ncbi:bZIP transcription factor, bZIP-1 [Cordyceps fumosorosea ARSEF 2679]|uniref:BZIP transcription factor, bZIP-1 n=1 Tax=Cordyceps fumosorosea (strain ARSEF 2679) TaxID=1081104 RepID=A0A166XVN1_CORFA|nr:bZIP transcription factor, bZIP-1 [Cordyceps fumosorosea ARSEF 2679]OAA36232.1 bZIP transcription factor, bZIP-1 [Cordyceps fumosorosea ARSEF 2679]
MPKRNDAGHKAPPRASNRPSSPCYGHDDASLNEDWRSASDPAEKKRIQNRVAQRNHRLRTKARIEELQKQLREHEAGASERNEQAGELQSSARPSSTRQSFSAAQPDSFTPHSVDGDIFDCIQLEEEPPNEPGDDAHHGLGERVFVSSKETLSGSPRSDEHVEHFFASQEAGGLTFHGSGSLWGPPPGGAGDAAANTEVSEASSSGNYLSGGGGGALFALHGYQVAAEQAAVSLPTPSPEEAAALDERVQHVMKQVESAGFSDFDALVTTYYCEPFREPSPLAFEQQLSRARRLPGVLAELSGAARRWPLGERRRFCDEAVRAAEGMLVLEGRAARSTLEAHLASLGAMIASPSKPCLTASDLHTMKNLIRKEQPHLWGLTMALVASFQGVWRHDRSTTALATIMLMQFSGRLDSSTLIQLVEAC